MKLFSSLVRHEIRILFASPATYIAAVLFLLSMGFVYYGIVEASSLREQTVHSMEAFFRWFFVPVFFMVPLLTMRSIAEERRLGTLETLMTTPATATEIVLAKFIASYVLYCALWGITLGFPLLTEFVVRQAGLRGQLYDSGSLLGGYLFLVLSGLLFIAIGIFSSCLTRSQLVAGMLSFSILFILILGPFLLDSQGLLPAIPWLDRSLDYVRVFDHLAVFGRGIIDTRPILYYLSNAFLVLVISILTVESKV